MLDKILRTKDHSHVSLFTPYTCDISANLWTNSYFRYASKFLEQLDRLREATARLTRPLKKTASKQDKEETTATEKKEKTCDKDRSGEQERHVKRKVPIRGVLSLLGGFLVQLTLGSYYRLELMI